MPAGYRSYYSDMQYVAMYLAFTSTTIDNGSYSGSVKGYGYYSDEEVLFIKYLDIKNGLTVRCVKNEE
jgi:hypothetical protein